MWLSLLWLALCWLQREEWSSWNAFGSHYFFNQNSPFNRVLLILSFSPDSELPELIRVLRIKLEKRLNIGRSELFCLSILLCIYINKRKREKVTANITCIKEHYKYLDWHKSGSEALIRPAFDCSGCSHHELSSYIEQNGERGIRGSYKYCRGKVTGHLSIPYLFYQWCDNHVGKNEQRLPLPRAIVCKFLSLPSFSFCHF